MGAKVDAIFVSAGNGMPVNRIGRVRALKARGLEGDRYCMDENVVDEEQCQVTLISAESLAEAESISGLRLSSGEHRRNLVIAGIELDELRNQRFSIGEAVMEYSGERPPCGYLERLTERGMKKTLEGRGGICARVVKSGWIEEGAPIEVTGSE